MSAIVIERQIVDAVRQMRVERAIQMREQGPTARGLPLQGITQFCGGDANEHQPRLPSPVTGGAFDDLGGIGKMNKAV